MTILAAVGIAREARIVAGPGVRVAVGGGRREGLERAMAEALDDSVTALISVGIAGALEPSLALGDVVIGSRVLGANGEYPVSEAWVARLTAALPRARTGTVLGGDRMVIAAADKARLYQDTGALSVDMESHVTARLAQARGLDFAVLRVISDVSTASLPSAVLDGLKPDGTPNLAGVFKGLARRPQELPGLIRLGRDSEAAFKALNDAWSQARPSLS